MKENKRVYLLFTNNSIKALMSTIYVHNILVMLCRENELYLKKFEFKNHAESIKNTITAIKNNFDAIDIEIFSKILPYVWLNINESVDVNNPRCPC